MVDLNEINRPIICYADFNTTGSNSWKDTTTYGGQAKSEQCNVTSISRWLFTAYNIRVVGRKILRR